MGINAIVGQSGGPTCVINSSLAGVFSACREHGVQKVYGMRHGVQGLLKDEVIDLTDALSLSSYYRTDTHWRQEALVPVASLLADAMDVSIPTDFTPVTLDTPFYGVYRGQSALPLAPDGLTYLTNDVLDACRVYDHENSEYLPVYTLEKADGSDPYEIFLSGPKSLLRIENPNAKTERRLIVFRDSFAASLVPLLAEGYSEITLVDIRYLSPTMLDKFIDLTAQDVLFLYSASVLNDSSTIK